MRSNMTGAGSAGLALDQRRGRTAAAGGDRLEINVVMAERYWVATPRAEATVHFVRGRCGTAA